jgi:translation initiation factor eIF-2B subunit beta
MHQLSPLFPHDPALAVNDFGSPAAVLDYAAVAAPVPGEGWTGDASMAGGGAGGGGGASSSSKTGGGGAKPGPPPLHVHAPRVDYIPPERIALFVTDTGGYTPSYVYRLLQDYYYRQDFSLGEAAALGC